MLTFIGLLAIMIVRKLRLKKGWSQEELAHISGLNVRTIQRFEKGHKPGLESKKSLAAAFEVELSTFNFETDNDVGDSSESNLKNTGEQNMAGQSKLTTENVTNEEKYALNYAKGVTEFLTHLILFLVVAPFSIIANNGLEKPLIIWSLAGWFVGVLIHGLNAFELVQFNFIKVNWEKWIAEKKLGRKL